MTKLVIIALFYTETIAYCIYIYIYIYILTKVLFVPTYALILSTLKSLKTLLLKIILYVSIFQDHHQGFFHSLPRSAASIHYLKCLKYL